MITLVILHPIVIDLTGVMPLDCSIRWIDWYALVYFACAGFVAWRLWADYAPWHCFTLCMVLCVTAGLVPVLYPRLAV